MSNTNDFTKFVPGFDFLQSLAKNAGSALPGIGQWVAPTLDPAELEKRIGELKTVQFWLEQNARMLSATIQALEVQKMTLSTLKTMNVQMGDLRETLKIKLPDGLGGAPATAEVNTPKSKVAATKPGNAIDPMQWWGALTNQFTQLATSALKDTAADAAKAMASGIVKQSFEAAADTFKKVATAPARAAAHATGQVVKPASPGKKAPATRRKPPARQGLSR